MPKLHERILNDTDLEEREEEEKALRAETKNVPAMKEYGEIRIPKTWTKPPALIDLKHDIEGALTEHDLIVAEINEYLAFYHTTPGKGRPHKIQGRSNAQPQSIRKAAEWRYSSLSEPFLDSPNIFKGEPTSGLDVEGTKQTELLLNFQMRNQIGLVEFIDDFIKDLVDTGTAIIRTSWEEIERSREVEQEVVKYIDAPELSSTYTQLIALSKEDPELFKRNKDPELYKGLEKSVEEGRPLRRVVVKTEKVTKVEVIKNQPDVKVCDYRDVIPDPTCRGRQDDLQFCGFRLRTTKATLKKDPRYFNVDDILITVANTVTRDSAHYANSESTSQDSDTFQFKDPNRQPIEGMEYWGFVDVDGSGILTPVVFTWFGDVLVRAEENPYPDKKIPFTFVPYLKKRNSLYGEPDGALLHEDQKISGAITRGVIDILAKNANGQRGTPKGALDYSNTLLYRTGQDYEYNPTVQIGRDGLAHITKFPEIPQSAIQIQQLSENNIKEMTGTLQGTGSQNHGSNLGTQAESAQTGGMSKAARRELGILRRIANGIIEVGHKICAMNKEFLDEEEVIRITDTEFSVISKDQLDCKYDLSLSISTSEDDSTKAQELAFMLQTSSSVMDPQFTRMLLADIADLRRMPGKAMQYRNYQPAPDPFGEAKAKLELAKLEAEVAEIQSRTAENQAEAQRELANAGKMDADAILAKAKADAIDLQYLEDESGLSHERDLQKDQSQAEGNMRLEAFKKDLENEEASPPAPANPIPDLQDNLTDYTKPSTNVPSNPVTTNKPQSLGSFEDELKNIGSTTSLLKN